MCDLIVNESIIQASEWVKKGEMLIQRSALDFVDPDSYWALWYIKFKEILPREFQQQLWNCDLPSKSEEDEILSQLKLVKFKPLYLR